MIPGFAVLGRSTDLINGDGEGLNSHLLSEKVNVRHGPHSLDIGGRFELRKDILRFAAFQSGRAIIPTLGDLSAAMPAADLFEIGTGGPTTSTRASVLDLYVHDEYRATPDWTVDFGLNYLADLLPSFLRNQYVVQPHVGLQWSPYGATDMTLKASYSMFRPPLEQFPANFELLMGGIGLQSNIPKPARLVTSFVNGSSTNRLRPILVSSTVPEGPPLATNHHRNTQTLTNTLPFPP